jgi:pimeloyl-ACP methyl ester carboxylesterase
MARGHQVEHATYQVFSPSDYASLGFKSPIVAWGNGTGAAPTAVFYSTLVTQLVSWGFTVVAPDLANTGSGTAIAAGARWLVDQDRRRGSPFFHRLAIDEVAAVGHSQGATGAVHAALADPSLIKTVMTFSLPWNGQGPSHSSFSANPGAPHGWSAANPDCPTWQTCWVDPGALRQPTFLVSTHGPLDAAIAPPAVERCYFQELRAPSALGIVLDSPPFAGDPADHDSISAHPSGLLGYATAWLLFELRHDAAAGRAFTGPDAQLVSDPNWPGSEVTGDRSGTATQHCDDRVAGAPRPA